MIKHQHREFPSDIFLVLETIGAQLVLASNATTMTAVSLQGFLAENIDKRIILNVSLPALDQESFVLRTYKVRMIHNLTRC